MRVSGSSGKRAGVFSLSSQQQQVKQPPSLKKSELLSDLFNNSAPKEEEGGSARLRISYSSKALYGHLKKNVMGFLQHHKPFAIDLEEIPLGEEVDESSLPSGDRQVRKLMVYHQWLTVGGETEVQEPPFKELQEHQLDEKVKELFQEHAGYQKEILEKRKKSTPNYYYLVHPETYSFN